MAIAHRDAMTPVPEPLASMIELQSVARRVVWARYLGEGDWRTMMAALDALELIVGRPMREQDI